MSRSTNWALPDPSVGEQNYTIVRCATKNGSKFGGYKQQTGPWIALWKSDPTLAPGYPGIPKDEDGWEKHRQWLRIHPTPYLPTEYVVLRYEASAPHEVGNHEPAREEFYRGEDRKEAERIYDALANEWGIVKKGGARTGAGHPNELGETKLISFDIPVQDLIALDKKAGGGRRADTLRQLVRQYIASDKC